MTTAAKTAAPATPTIPLNDVVEHFAHRAAESGVSLTHMKLQYLCYYVQVLHWSRFGGPLFEERVEAWPGTPILPAVWRDYEKWEVESLPPSLPSPPNLPSKQRELVDEVFCRYAFLTVVELVTLHSFAGPWQDLDYDGHAEIPGNLLRKHGRELEAMLALEAEPAARPHVAADSEPPSRW